MEDLERLYKTHYAAVVRFLYRKIWDADRAEDLAQEVFIRAMAHQPDKPRAWIFAVAANLARDEARAAWREQQRQRTLRRRGRKGARVWGYNTGGGRRAKGRDQ